MTAAIYNKQASRSALVRRSTLAWLLRIGAQVNFTNIVKASGTLCSHCTSAWYSMYLGDHLGLSAIAIMREI